jgi:hypothetical protein
VLRMRRSRGTGMPIGGLYGGRTAAADARSSEPSP